MKPAFVAVSANISDQRQMKLRMLFHRPMPVQSISDRWPLNRKATVLPKIPHGDWSACIARSSAEAPVAGAAVPTAHGMDASLPTLTAPHVFIYLIDI